MTPEQRARVEQILDALLEVLPKDRNAELDRLCSHDSETRTEVARLLSAMADNSALHEPSIAEMFKQAVNLANAAAEDMPAGTIIGSYRILENLGEGGFGSVYRAAERGDIKRVVALKVIKPGVDTKEVLARFESERQALAYMNHAGIAKLFSAGKTERGRPYFVMEYVPGIRITEFADRNRLIVTDRLRMFQQVCYAINHAHQKGIIHRDIKASNVLAFYVDGRIMAKIIDFGIAKALTGDRLTDRSFQETGSGIAIGTYESMSPEQANGDPDIDTRTDIYSLGVLLYELLVSVKPLNEKILIDANDEVIRQNICEIDAPNPSSQLLSLGASAMTIAGARQISLPDLIMMLKSELEWIPLKAMRKERERRYASVLALAEDVNNYLENRPLKAGPESLAYYMRKLCRRNRSIFLTTATFIVTLAVILSTYIYNIKAERARTVEQSTAREMEAARANQNAAIAKINAIEKSRLADKLKLQAGDSDYQLGNLLAGNHDADALAYLARALRENNANRNAVLLSIMILYRYRVPLQELRHGDFVNSAMFSPDGTRIVTASSDNTARVWDAITGKPIGLPMRHEDAVFSASFSPDGTRVVTASEDNTACVWDAAKGKLLGNAMRHEKAYVHAVFTATFSADGTRVVTAGADNTARVWNAASGKPLGEPMRHDGAVMCAMFSPDGSRVVTASLDNTARVWNATTGKLLGEPMQHNDAVFSASFSPDGMRVVTASADDTARVWNAASCKPLGEPMRHRGSVRAAAFSPDGLRVVTASFDGTACVWDAATGKALGEPMRHEDFVHSAQFSPDGIRIVTASDDNTARIWDAATGTQMGESLQHGGFVHSATFSPDGLRVVTASTDSTAQEWDVADQHPLSEPMRHGAAINSAVFSPDGKRIVTASDDKTACVWDAATGEPIGKPMQHRGSVHFATFSPDSARVVTVSDDNTAEVWDVGTGKPLGAPIRHTAPIHSAVFSPSGIRILTASDDGTARMWDAVTGRQFGESMRHDAPIFSASYSSNGK
ncbi:MAG TPA: serine/threonine-protein kinase, partial [Tepidisphaeraceae bacterium]